MPTPYSLEIEGLDGLFSVRSIDGRERISRTYRFEIVARADSTASEQIERRALGRRAQLVFEVGKTPRAFNGVISRMRVVGPRDQNTCEYRIELVPRMWLLKQQRRTRIFQNQRVIDVVASVLGAMGIASRWQLQRRYPIREYCTQYEETDYQFVTRILAENGIYFYFYQGGPSEIAGAAASLAMSAAASVAPAVSAMAAAVGPLVSGESIVLADDAAFYPALGDDSTSALVDIASMASALPIEVPGGLGGAVSAAVHEVAALTESLAPPLVYLELETSSGNRLDKIMRFDIEDVVRPTIATFREYDPDRPLMNFVSSAVSNSPFSSDALDMLASAAAGAVSAVGGISVGGVSVSAAVKVGEGVVDALAEQPPFLEVYAHHDPMLFPKWETPSDEAPRMLRQERRRASVARGKSGCPDLGPARRFTLQRHAVARLDGAYVVIEVRHRGNTYPKEALRPIYECNFECVPATVTYIPPRPKRKSVQVSLTAVVVGPHGSEIHVDEKGQIKVQFHWDREGKGDDNSSCWIRTMHAWAGAGWGTQFIPRVGMEVVVVFEGGDPDKPMVIGSIANATHPMPFKLPGDKTRSGFRSSTSPGGKGFNELSFEDDQGKEQIYIQAQRDLDEVIRHNHTLRVENDELLRVLGNRIDTIEKDLKLIVKGDRVDEVAGNYVQTVAGDSDQRVKGMRTSRSEGKVQHHGKADMNIECDADVTLRTLGSVTTLVGQRTKPRSWVTHAEGVATLTGLKRLSLSSETEIELSVGKSSLRMTADKLEISAAAVTVKGGGAGLSASDDGLDMSSKGNTQLTVGKKLTIKTDGASLSLEKEVKIDGSKILLNSPEKAEDPAPAPADPPTTIALCDDDGSPLAEQRFVLLLDDQSQQSGMTDADGKAELDLKVGGSIIFPELTMRGDEPKGAPQPYVVRQGDYFQKLAFKNGFDADKVWNDAKNADLKKKRKDPNQLHPGDLLYFAPSDKKPYPLSKGTSNDYTASVPKTKLQLYFKDELTPFTGESYSVEGLPKPLEGTVGGDGGVTIEAPVHVREVRVVFAKRNVTFAVGIGDMDPVNEESGVRARLQHLGYLRSPGEGLSESDADARLIEALKQFQIDKGLTPNGKVDDEATQAALTEAHGA